MLLSTERCIFLAVLLECVETLSPSPPSHKPSAAPAGSPAPAPRPSVSAGASVSLSDSAAAAMELDFSDDLKVRAEKIVENADAENRDFNLSLSLTLSDPTKASQPSQPDSSQQQKDGAVADGWQSLKESLVAKMQKIKV